MKDRCPSRFVGLIHHSCKRPDEHKPPHRCECGQTWDTTDESLTVGPLRFTLPGATATDRRHHERGNR